MKLIIYSAYIGNAKSLRSWTPENDEIVSELVSFDIGPKSKKEAADSFCIRIATPKGLAEMDASARPLLVMQRYDYNDFWNWLEKTVESCESDTWNSCVERLRYYFDWEYDSYKQS